VAEVKDRKRVSVLNPASPWFQWIVFLLLLGVLGAGWMGYLDPVRVWLDAPEVTLDIEGVSLSPYRVLKVALILVAFIWVAAILNTLISRYVGKLPVLTASNRTLVTKVLQILVYILIFFMAMNVLGVDLTAFTVFSGAVGIGIGFGFQKVASNFVSGLIMLFEKSVKLDDLIEFEDVAGFVRKTGGRYTMVETFDGKEVMIPNEDFITGRVTNWTHSNLKGRVDIAIGVAYGSDYEKARDCILAAAHEHPLCSKDPEPQCYLLNFGDSSVDFVLYFWVDDIRTGRYKPKSDVMFAITHKFREAGITIPFPQRDVHMKSEPGEAKANEAKE